MYQKPVLLERIAFGLKLDGSTEVSKKALGKHAIKYLNEVNYTNTPHLNLFLSYSDMKLEDIKSGGPGGTEIERDVILEKIIAHEYADALRLLESKDIVQNQYFQKLECIANVHLLAKGYHSVQELGTYLMDVDNKGLHGNEEQSLRRLKLLICASYYMEGKFFECCSNFCKYAENESDLLGYSSEGLLLKKEYILMVTISSVVSVPLDNYAKFIYLQPVNRIRDQSKVLLNCMEPLIQTRFKDFFKYWNETIGESCYPCLFVIDQWNFAQLIMRSKIYFFYLRISTKLGISYMAKILGIDERQTRDEIHQLVDSTGLNVQIVDDVISYKNNHLFLDAVEKLKMNEVRLQSILEDQKKNNVKLRDEVQQNIINNEEVIEETVRREQGNIIDQQSFLNEDMDIDDDITMDEVE